MKNNKGRDIEHDIFLRSWTSVRGANKELISHVKYLIASEIKEFAEEIGLTHDEFAGWRDGSGYDNGYKDGYNQTVSEVIKKIKQALEKRSKK